MVITYHNETCFKVVSGKVSAIVDPPNEKFKADITLETRSKISEIEYKSGEIKIHGGGEYEVQEIAVRGIQVNYDAKNELADTMYSVTIEGISIFFMGNISSAPSVEILENIGEVDILFIPVGKGHLDPKSAAKLVKQIQPRIIVPYPPQQVSSFLDEIGQKCENLDKLVLKKKDIIEMGEKTKIVCIKA